LVKQFLNRYSKYYPIRCFYGSWQPCLIVNSHQSQNIERNIFPSLVSIPSVLVEKKTEILKLMEDGYQVMAIAHPTLQIK
jgi:hypothetical protein